MTEPKPLRADARRNRAKVLEAAERVFAERGTGAPTEDVAKAAGVGIGTVFRHFPSKEALLEAVLIQRLHAFADHAEHVAAQEPGDPGAAFFDFVSSWLEMAKAKAAYFEALTAAGVHVPRMGSVVGVRLMEALGVILARGQAAGAVRPDLTGTELVAVIVGLAKSVEHAGDDHELRDRAVAIVLDGLRSGA